MKTYCCCFLQFCYGFPLLSLLTVKLQAALSVFQSTVKNTNLIKEGAMRQRRLAAAVTLLLAVSVTGCMEDNMRYVKYKMGEGKGTKKTIVRTRQQVTPEKKK